jgi:hypothetical protein
MSADKRDRADKLDLDNLMPIDGQPEMKKVESKVSRKDSRKDSNKIQEDALETAVDEEGPNEDE